MMRWNVFWRRPETGKRKRAGCWILSYGPTPGTQMRVPREIAPGPEERWRAPANQWAAKQIAKMELDALAVAAPPLPAPEATIRERRDEWLALKNADERLSPATCAEYESHLDLSVLPHLGEQRFGEVDIPALRAWVRVLRSKNAASTVRNRFSTFSTFWDDARAEGWTKAPNLARDPAVRSELPELPRYSAKTISIEAFALLVLCSKVPPIRILRYLSAGLAGLCDGEIAGLRVGSVYGLRAADQLAQSHRVGSNGVAPLSPEPGFLIVRKAVAIHGKGGFATENALKNKYRERQIPIHPVLAEALAWWIEIGWEIHVCRKPTPEDYLFPRDNGKPWRPKSADLLREDLALAGVPDVPEGFKFHSLRACFQTWLEEQGVAQACRDRLLGHRGKSTAAVHYTPAVMIADREAVNKIPFPLVRDLVRRALDLSHLRDLNPRPTVYETDPASATSRPDTLRSGETPHESTLRNGTEAGNGLVSSARLVRQEGGPLPAELAELTPALRGLVTPWDAMELWLERIEI